MIKLHGSVNWGRLASIAKAIDVNDPVLARTFAARGEALNPHPEIVLRQSDDGVRGFRVNQTGKRFFYPALSAPLGSEDELMCPPQHVEYLRERLRAYDGLNLLVIGYSGLDKEVLRLLSESGNTVRHLMVVNGSAEESARAANKLVAVLKMHPRGQGIRTFDGGFSRFASAGDFAPFFAALT